jgi:hypothetical protein
VIWRKLSRHGVLFTNTTSTLEIPDRYPPIHTDLKSLKLAINGKVPFLTCPQDFDSTEYSDGKIRTGWRTSLDKTETKGVYFNRRTRKWVPVKVKERKRTNSYEHLLLQEDYDDPQHPKNNPASNLDPRKIRRRV